MALFSKKKKVAKEPAFKQVSKVPTEEEVMRDAAMARVASKKRTSIPEQEYEEELPIEEEDYEDEEEFTEEEKEIERLKQEEKKLEAEIARMKQKKQQKIEGVEKEKPKEPQVVVKVRAVSSHEMLNHLAERIEAIEVYLARLDAILKEELGD